MALSPPPLKSYDCANFTLGDINKFAKSQGYAVLQVVRIAVEVKMPLWIACQVFSSNILQAYSRRGASAF